MGRYAKTTSVPSDRSKAEIERTLCRYGATEFAYGVTKNQVIIGFSAHDRRIRFILELPSLDSVSSTATGRSRDTEAARKAHEQAVRQQWRALCLVIKAKLESVESGIEIFEQAFFANIVLPGGKTVYEEAHPHVEQAYLTGKVPPLLTHQAM